MAADPGLQVTEHTHRKTDGPPWGGGWSGNSPGPWRSRVPSTERAPATGQRGFSRLVLMNSPLGQKQKMRLWVCLTTRAPRGLLWLLQFRLAERTVALGRAIRSPKLHPGPQEEWRRPQAPRPGSTLWPADPRRTPPGRGQTLGAAASQGRYAQPAPTAQGPPQPTPLS